MSGHFSRRKGYRYENELRLEFLAHGLPCRRVALSGAGYEKGDIVVTCGWGETQIGEAKRRARLPAYLTRALEAQDFVVFREDRGRSFVLLTLDRFKDLCT